jgi:hypothetical protein
VAFDISAPVGVGVANRSDDVQLIHDALNQIHFMWGGTQNHTLPGNHCTNDTIKAIKRFQKRNFGWQDGVISPGKDTIQKLNQVLDGLVDIVAIEAEGTPDNGFDADARNLWDGELQVRSVGDLVQQVLTMLSLDPSGKLIKTLTIVGHGSPGSQSVGAGMDWDNGFPSQSLTLARIMEDNPAANDDDETPALWGSAAQEWPRLATSFAPGGLVILGGCKVAVEDSGDEYQASQITGNGGPRKVNGRKLLMLLSSLLGGSVFIEGGVVDQFSAKRGMEGPCIRCNAAGCVVGHTGGRYQWGPVDDFTPE